jgi:hypothetical protein
VIAKHQGADSAEEGHAGGQQEGGEKRSGGIGECPGRAGADRLADSEKQGDETESGRGEPGRFRQGRMIIRSYCASP